MAQTGGGTHVIKTAKQSRNYINSAVTSKSLTLVVFLTNISCERDLDQGHNSAHSPENSSEWLHGQQVRQTSGNLPSNCLVDNKSKVK